MTNFVVVPGFFEISEVSIGRVIKHAKHSKFAVISAHRGDKPATANKSAGKELQKQIRTAGKGYIRMVGSGQEIDPTTKQVKPAKEKSVMVPGLSRKKTRKMAAAHNQDYFIHGNKGQIRLINTKTGRVEMRWNHTAPKQSEFSSKVSSGRGKHRHFTFENEMIQFVVIPNFSEAVDPKARMARVSKLRGYASQKMSDAYKKGRNTHFTMDNVKDARKAHRASKIADKGERRLLFPKK